MTTTTLISYHAATKSSTCEYGTSERAESVISQVIGHDTSILYANNGNRRLEDHEIKGQLGAGKWTVVYSSGADEEMRSLRDEVEKLKQTTSGLEKKVDILQVQTVDPYLRIVAASILLFLIGEQPRTISTASSRFKRHNDPKVRSRIRTCAKAIGYLDERFKSLADGILDRRNNSVHPGDSETLTAMVAKANDMIDSYPTTRKHSKDEVMIIENFNVLKTHFP